MDIVKFTVNWNQSLIKDVDKFNKSVGFKPLNWIKIFQLSQI